MENENNTDEKCLRCGQGPISKYRECLFCGANQELAQVDFTMRPRFTREFSMESPDGYHKDVATDEISALREENERLKDEVAKGRMLLVRAIDYVLPQEGTRILRVHMSEFIAKHSPFKP